VLATAPEEVTTASTRRSRRLPKVRARWANGYVTIVVTAITGMPAVAEDVKEAGR
jgi:hypothetical protein